MSIHCQALVDNVFAAFGAPATIVDVRGRLLALSHQPDDQIDQIRRDVVLHRPVVAGVNTHFLRHLQKIDRFGRIPGHEELGILPRTILALRSQRTVVGHLYLIDPECRVTHLSLAPFADEILAVESELELEWYARARSVGVLDGLLTGDRATRRSAALLLGPEGPDHRSGHTVVALDSSEGTAQVSHATWSRLFRGAFVWGMVGDRPVSIVQGNAQGVLQRVNAAPGAGVASLVVGVGGRVGTLEDVHHSYQQALLALQFARSRATESRVAQWDALGAWRTLLLLDLEEALASIDDRVQRMIRNEDLQVLQMVLRYLERGSEAATIAADFHLHRTTVYSRLRRLQTRYGLSWDDPDDRLMSIIGVRIGLLHPQRPAARDESARFARAVGMS